MDPTRSLILKRGRYEDHEERIGKKHGTRAELEDALKKGLETFEAGGRQ